MKSPKTVRLALLALALLSSGLACAAQGVSQATEPASKPSKAANTKTKKAKAPKPKFDQGSGETRAERDKRLARECKGKPNAGACEGFGS